ncbi:hypothetical protein MTR67_022808 [Solanum verrucosum]|uniref:Uncharacterized protein n=1 Tax=Solanum verrucosum TaxID=315347 RepID=A0AAF0TY67_SOLVR|nr:hypothetical protein MTR67_022808 [Solanum verrucosum]
MFHGKQETRFVPKFGDDRFIPIPQRSAPTNKKIYQKILTGLPGDVFICLVYVLFNFFFV